MAARDAILDAAASVMRDRGLARATTKEIARAAGYSEALLYKHFDDKQALFLAVLSERAPTIPGTADLDPAAGVIPNLERLVTGLLQFYLRSFPIAASLMSERALLGPWRAGLAERGVGPHQPVQQVARHIESEQAAGRIPSDVDATAIAELLCGAALQQAFFANFADDLEFAEAPEIARRLVAALRLA